MAQQSIFQGVLAAIKGKAKGEQVKDSSKHLDGAASSASIFSPRAGNIEDVQQQYLDWQSNKIAHDLYTRTLYFDTSRIVAYQDFRAMDMSPEISAALNILRDECLEANTIVPLLNGQKLTIEELYNSDRQNFYVYSYNADLKKFEPGLCERVVYKGEQNVYKITFDDDSSIMATSEHLWLTKGKNEYLKTSELTEGQSLEPFYSKISGEDDRINGYQMLFEHGKWEYTHRIVKREIFPNEKGVVHHKDIKKLNNDPSNLQMMTWFEHQELHHKLNSERWQNDIEYSEKMKKIFSETNSADGPYWSNPEWRAQREKEMSDSQKLKYSSYSQEELKNVFGYPGELNPMYGQGFKLEGEKNGRYLKDKKREFTLEELLCAFDKHKNIEEACIFLNTTRRILYKSKLYKDLNLNRWEDLGFYKQNISIETIDYSCKKYLGKIILEKSLGFISKENGWIPKKVNTFLLKNGFQNWVSYVKKYDSKKCILENVKKAAIVHSTHNFSEICRLEGYSRKQIEGLISRSEYKTPSALLESVNHKVKIVEFVGKRKTYDLVNVGKHSNFSVLTSNGTGVISHNCLTRSERGNILEIYSENSRVKKALTQLFKNKLNIDYNLRLWIRDLIKYGDYFVHLHIDKEIGIYDFMTLPMEEMHREEGHDGKIDSVRFRWETKNEYFEEWQIAHFRMLEDTKRLPYGRSILDSARKLWKQLQLAEDAMLVYRITRAPERRVFYIEVGNLEDADVTQYIQKIQNRIKKQPVVNQQTGDYNMKYNPMNITEDYFIPIRGDKASKIDTLPGAQNLGEIEDIEYLQNKLFACLQVPKTYLNFAENLPGGSTLSQADLRFARTINSIQEAVLLELRRIANIHLYFLGFTDDIDNFTLSLTNPSTQQELLKLETMKARLEVFKEMFSADATAPASYTWAMENILGFSKNDIKLILKQKKVEKKIFAEIDSAVETYKKIGLFKELDDKYELPGAPQTTAGAGEEGGGEGAGGAADSGGGGAPSGEAMDLSGAGGGPEAGAGAGFGPETGGIAGAEAGAGAGAGPAGAGAAGGAGGLSESKQRKQVNKIMAESDSNAYKLIDSLLDETEAVKKKLAEEENPMLKSNRELTGRAEKLINQLNKNFHVDEQQKELLGESEIEKENDFLKNNEKMLSNSNDIMEKLDKLFGNSGEKIE